MELSYFKVFFSMLPLRGTNDSIRIVVRQQASLLWNESVFLDYLTFPGSLPPLIYQARITLVSHQRLI